MEITKSITTFFILIAAFVVAVLIHLATHEGKKARHQLEHIFHVLIEEAHGLHSTMRKVPGETCLRDCTADPTPRVCFFIFELEEYSTMNGACDFCTPQYTNYVSNDCACIKADGVERSIIAVNRSLPGPAVYVCKNDRVVVDIHNYMEGVETTIHWHGIDQRGTQYYDGVPFVTQCPIHSGDIFRYQFKADVAGTFMYHSHSGLQKYNGLVGSVVVRDSKTMDPHGQLYDEDLWSHTMLMQDWLHGLSETVFPGLIRSTNKGKSMVPVNILINGRGEYHGPNSVDVVVEDPGYAYFNVTPGKRYRFRMINAFSGICPAELTIEGHNMTLIATDAYPIEPVEVTSILSMTGERFDFILEANQEPRAYWIQVRGLYSCANTKVQQFAVLKYEGGAEVPTTTIPTYDNPLNTSIVVNPLDGKCEEARPGAYCINQLNNSDTSAPILTMKPDLEFYIPFQIWRTTDPKEFYSSKNKERHFVPSLTPVLGLVNGISYTYPPAPALSQFNDIPPGFICNTTDCGEPFCGCFNVMRIPLGSVVDLILVDTVNISNLYHPMHLHGTPFYVLSIGLASDLNMTDITVSGVRSAREHGQIPMRLDLSKGIPPAKDTISVPTNGFAIVRFKADNPGFWLLHCHVDIHAVTGMSMVFWVGELDDLPPVPDTFPVCNNFQPKIDRGS